MDKHANKRWKGIRNAGIVLFWLILILICCRYKDQITVDTIVNHMPQNSLAAVLLMLGLFALKSVTFLYGGILYAASGILFSFPAAILVNLAGSVVMTTIPFFIGKKAGEPAIAKLIEKYPKCKILRDIPNENEGMISFFVRMVGCLPANPIGVYLGASGIRYSRYLCGTILGLTPSVVTFTIMGMRINDVTSPAFLISAAVEIGLMIASAAIYLIWKRKGKKKPESMLGGTYDQ